MIAFSKIAGFEVSPRRDFSSTSALSSPDSIIWRWIWSSQTATPASVSAFSRSFCAMSCLLDGAMGAPGRLG